MQMSRTRFTKEMREIIPILKANGYSFARCKGSHFVFINRTTGRHVTINKDLNREVKARLIKEMEDYANAK